MDTASLIDLTDRNSDLKENILYRNIIWDVDGTIFNTYPPMSRAFKAALNELGADATLSWLEKQARISLSHCSETLSEKFRLPEPEITRAFLEHYKRIPFQDQQPFDGVIDICTMIQSRGGMNLIITHRGKESTNRLLSAHQMSHLFTDCFAQDAGFPKKPDPAAFLAMIDKYKLDREETLAVGDRDLDVEAGQSAGLFACLFTIGTSFVQPDLTFDNYQTLKQFLSDH